MATGIDEQVLHGRHQVMAAGPCPDAVEVDVDPLAGRSLCLDERPECVGEVDIRAGPALRVDEVLEAGEPSLTIAVLSWAFVPSSTAPS